MDDDLQLSYQATIEFPHKGIFSHTKAILSRPVALAAAFIAALSTTLGIVGQVFGGQPAAFSILSFTTAISAVFAFVWVATQYVNDCPKGFENTSREAQRLANLLPRKWESRLALQLLAERIGPIDRECNRLLAKKEFVMLRHRPNYSDYWSWVRGRTESIQEMIRLANYLLVREFVPSVVSTDSAPACPIKMLSAVEALERLYRETVEFEREMRSVLPPAGCERLHDLQLGWAEPVRDAVLQLFQLLERIRSHKTKSSEAINLAIEFKDPPNLQEFMRECDELFDRIPELLGDRIDG